MKTKIVQPTPPEKEVPAEVIATSIEAMAKVMKEFEKTRLKPWVLVLLIHDKTKLPKREIAEVLNSLDTLAEDWLKPAPQKK